ncbi:beta-ketoacyl synthase chain length factor [Mesoterricola silvestris]|uniref:Beta-ketoacyl synthase-like N-terminal domain-containing protein n=1 Tax=Mesoterricola silvestris TaxID=2927979 RepID=A0AA48GKI4_9BACT|nr:beta-ketoacyl synthase chain length factor [Mesoterricola silvestris]BDU71444.1 hypothetical protein METEAL_06180 [Mesoterricola silvestris]
MTVRVLGIGAVGGFGCGAENLGLAPGEPGTLTLPWGEGTRGIPAFRADTTPLERFVERKALRRVDHFSRMALLGAHLALEDAGRTPEGLALVVASGFGPTGTTFSLIDSMMRDGDACTSPIHFAGSLHNTPAAHIGIFLGITGPCLTLSRFEGLVPSALTAARLLLAEGRAERVLVGVVDEFSELMGYLWARGESRPVAGEGAAFLLLSAREEDGPGACALEEAEAAAGPWPWGAMPGAQAFAIAAAAARIRSSRR